MGKSIEEQRESIRKSKSATTNRISFIKYSVEDYLVRGIYFLYYKGNIVYIGKSDDNVFERISEHFKSIKEFDEFSFKEYNVSKKQLDEMEKRLINKFKPKYNNTHIKNKINKPLILGMNIK
jgi:predicted small metal-binding protein